MQYYKNGLIVGRSSCPYTRRAIELLPDATFIDITDDIESKDFLKELLKQTTVPYVFVDDEFIGGASELESYLR